MILINLLPHREARRKERKRAFLSALGLAALVGVGVVMLWFGVLQQLTSMQQGRNQFLQTEIGKLEAQIKDVATLKEEIEALKARQKAVEDLQADRNVPVYLLDELVKQTPEGVFLASVRQDGALVTVQGYAQTNERVSEMLRNTAYNSPWLERPELVESKSIDLPMGKATRRLFDFSMRMTLKRPQETEASASTVGSGAVKLKPTTGKAL